MNTREIESAKKLSINSYELNLNYKQQILNTIISKICLDLKKIMKKKNLLVCIYEVD